jgi:short coiled-coil protein
MLGRVKSVKGEVDKLMAGNATLQMYIDNLTVQMAKQR